jgi:signal recognition particle receptor subunit beta
MLEDRDWRRAPAIAGPTVAGEEDWMSARAWHLPAARGPAASLTAFGSPSGQVFKILVTGPFAAGKTSLIQSVSQTPVVGTDVATSGDEAALKAMTTVAMDFGTFALEGDDVRLLLFGTPGQPRFWFMTDVLKGEVDVVVFVVDAEAVHSHAEAGAAMRALLRDLRVPLVVAVNRCDDAEEAAVLARALGALASEPAVPCQLIDPDSGRDVVVETLVALLDALEQPRDAEPRDAGPGDAEPGDADAVDDPALVRVT